ncbi:hypothetical protein M5E87_06895 [Flavonifractor plautii]|nr:hypothetical protein M5E87_06895 [Flavonifractor plautii]
MITFREIDKSNYMECICLKVKDEQRGFVADNARSWPRPGLKRACIPGPSIPTASWSDLSCLIMTPSFQGGA